MCEYSVGSTIIISVRTFSRMITLSGVIFSCVILMSISASSFLLWSSGFAHLFISPNISHHTVIAGLIAVL